MNILYTLIIKNKNTGRVLCTFNYYPQSLYDWEKLKIDRIKKVCNNYVLDKSDLLIEETTSYGKRREVEA